MNNTTGSQLKYIMLRSLQVVQVMGKTRHVSDVPLTMLEDQTILSEHAKTIVPEV